MAFPRIAAFARLAKGGDGAERVIAGQKTLLNRSMHDIEYDGVNDEILIANPYAQAILTYRGGADGEEAPIRVLQGPSTQMAHPDYAVHVDKVNNELYVTEKEYILVFPRTANGDVAPIRVIRGPDTRLINTRGLVVDPIRNLLIASTAEGVMIFPRTANGNAKPIRTIVGPKSGVGMPFANLRILPEKGLIVGMVRRSFGEPGEAPPEALTQRNRRERPGGAIAVWSVNDNGDIPPIWVLSNPGANIGGIRLALNPKWKEVIVGGGNNMKIYSFPEIF
ncbi:MAG: hypothetical protein O7E51_15725 [Acidobacteria bacterium]|nr:hypothetical protein [Acidobacteriota bacterium]